MLLTAGAACATSETRDAATPTPTATPAVEPEPTPTPTPTRQARTFTTVAPDGWVEEPDRVAGIDGVFYSTPRSSNSAVDNVNIVASPSGGLTLDEFDQLTRSQSTTMLGFVEVEPPTRILIADQPGSSTVWEAMIDPASEPSRFWSAWTMHGDNVYVFTYRSTPETFETNLAGAAEILESLEFVS